MLLVLLAAFLLLESTVLAQTRSFEERLSGWLREPGVRVVAVEFYSDYCEPCKKAAPEWERLRRKPPMGIMLGRPELELEPELPPRRPCSWSASNACAAP